LQGGPVKKKNPICGSIVTDFDETSMSNVENSPNNPRFWAHTVVMVIIVLGVLYVCTTMPTCVFLSSIIPVYLLCSLESQQSCWCDVRKIGNLLLLTWSIAGILRPAGFDC
jgi:hypothetical protein